ncbi:hypothetical protein VB005_01922 [Metarhizium brunneum]
MSREKVVMTYATGAGLIGATIRYAKNQTETEDIRNIAQQKHDIGLSGAGIGGNGIAGGTGIRSSNHNGGIERQTFFGSNRWHTSRGDQTGQNGNEPKAQLETKSNSPEKSGRFNSMKSAVSGKDTASRKGEEGLHDTKGIGKMGKETPSKREPADASD